MTNLKITAFAAFIALSALSGVAKAQSSDEITLPAGSPAPQEQATKSDTPTVTTAGWYYVRTCYYRWYYVGTNYYGQLVYRRYHVCS